MAKKVKKKFSWSELECLQTAFEHAIVTLDKGLSMVDTDDKDMQCLLIAGLNECLMSVKKSLVENKPRYTINFTAVQCFAIRSFFAGIPGEFNQATTIIYQLCNEADRAFA